MNTLLEDMPLTDIVQYAAAEVVGERPGHVCSTRDVHSRLCECKWFLRDVTMQQVYSALYQCSKTDRLSKTNDGRFYFTARQLMRFEDDVCAAVDTAIAIEQARSLHDSMSGGSGADDDADGNTDDDWIDYSGSSDEEDCDDEGDDGCDGCDRCEGVDGTPAWVQAYNAAMQAYAAAMQAYNAAMSR